MDGVKTRVKPDSKQESETGPREGTQGNKDHSGCHVGIKYKGSKSGS